MTTSKNIKYHVKHDFASRDDNFVNKIKNIRTNILNMVNTNNDTHSTILMQGTCTYGNESSFGIIT